MKTIQELADSVTSKHTPGPVKAVVWDYPTRREIVITNDKDRLATLAADCNSDNPYMIPWDEAQANAERLCRAWNSHDELVAALKQAELAFADTAKRQGGREYGAAHDARVAIKAALAAANIQE